jgi:hypothetical protein
MITQHAVEVPADPNITPQAYSRRWFRFLEILPGATVWLAIILPFIVSGFAPLWVTIFIILFDIYWFLGSVQYAIAIVRGYRRLKHNSAVDWDSRLTQLHALSPAERERWLYLDSAEVYHAVILVTYKESQKILEQSLDSMVSATFPKERIIVVLATEERDAANARRIAAALREKYSHQFGGFLVTEHPDGIVGEVKAKGANASWAAKQLTPYIEEQGIPLDRVIVSTADADTRFPSYYFSCLAYTYCATPDRTRASFQPIATFFNNIWEAPMFSRMMAFGTTYWQLGESVRDYRLITFSTHATSLRTLVDMDYWCTSIVNEDSRQFFRAFFHYRGNFRVVPLFIPIYMDAVHVGSFFPTMRNLYLQQQRWAYGVEHFPYIVLESHRLRRVIPFQKRAALIWRAFEGMFSWATTAFFLTVVGWLPILLNTQFRGELVASNFPQVASTLISLTWVGLIIAAGVSVLIMPPLPDGRHPFRWVGMLVQWVLTPVTSIIFGAIPSLDAQTRLMLGKYIGFQVTEKDEVKPL